MVMMIKDGINYASSASVVFDFINDSAYIACSMTSLFHQEMYWMRREEFIALAILRLVEMEKAVVEGAGAVALAAVLGDYVPELKGKK
jgi:threonine dehydratase